MAARWPGYLLRLQAPLTTVIAQGLPNSQPHSLSSDHWEYPPRSPEAGFSALGPPTSGGRPRGQHLRVTARAHSAPTVGRLPKLDVGNLLRRSSLPSQAQPHQHPPSTAWSIASIIVSRRASNLSSNFIPPRLPILTTHIQRLPHGILSHRPDQQVQSRTTTAHLSISSNPAFETGSRRGQGPKLLRNQRAILSLEIVSIYSNNQGGCRGGRSPIGKLLHTFEPDPTVKFRGTTRF